MSDKKRKEREQDVGKEREQEVAEVEEWVLVHAKESEYKDCSVYATKSSNLTPKQWKALQSGELKSIRAEGDLEKLGIPLWHEDGGSMWKCIASDEDDKGLHEFTNPKHRRLCQSFYVWSE